MAILLPILFTIALLCVDFGRFAHSYIAVTNAARVGAAYGSAHPFSVATKPIWDARVQDKVSQELETNSWFDIADLTVPAPVATQEPNGFWRIQVEARYPFETLINWPFVPGYNEPHTLSHVVVMRVTP